MRAQNTASDPILKILLYRPFKAKRSEAKRVRKCEGMRRNSKGNTKEFEREYEEGKVDPKQKKTEQSRTKQSTQA